jgi:hypothetical protein
MQLILYRVAQLWLDAKTASKVVFLDKNSASEAFRELIPEASDLPVGLGGQLAEPEPLIEVWPKSGGGLLSWLGWGSKATSSDASAPPDAAAAADNDDDPLASLSPEQRALKLQQLEDEQLAEARAITAADQAKPKPQCMLRFVRPIRSAGLYRFNITILARRRRKKKKGARRKRV